MKAHKSSLREEIRARPAVRRSDAERHRAGEAVWRQITRHIPLEEIETIAVYFARHDEIPVLDTIPSKIRESHDWVVPAWDDEARRYRWSRVRNGTQWVRGPHGVPQPHPPEWVPADQVGVVLVPGLAFDPRGGRLGRGGGDYDRLLAECSCVRIGVSWDDRVMEKVPLESHDQTMDWIVTERRVWKCGRHARDLQATPTKGAGS